MDRYRWQLPEHTGSGSRRLYHSSRSGDCLHNSIDRWQCSIWVWYIHHQQRNHQSRSKWYCNSGYRYCGRRTDFRKYPICILCGKWGWYLQFSSCKSSDTEYPIRYGTVQRWCTGWLWDRFYYTDKWTDWSKYWFCRVPICSEFHRRPDGSDAGRHQSKSKRSNPGTRWSCNGRRWQLVPVSEWCCNIWLQWTCSKRVWLVQSNQWKSRLWLHRPCK